MRVCTERRSVGTPTNFEILIQWDYSDSVGRKHLLIQSIQHILNESSLRGLLKKNRSLIRRVLAWLFHTKYFILLALLLLNNEISRRMIIAIIGNTVRLFADKKKRTAMFVTVIKINNLGESLVHCQSILSSNHNRIAGKQKLISCLIVIDEINHSN